VTAAVYSYSSIAVVYSPSTRRSTYARVRSRSATAVGPAGVGLAVSVSVGVSVDVSVSVAVGSSLLQPASRKEAVTFFHAEDGIRDSTT
jgi:hypothetical protein